MLKAKASFGHGFINCILPTGSPSKSAEATVLMVVIDADEYTPEVTVGHHDITVIKSTTINTTLLFVDTTDKDGGIYGVVR